MHAFALLVLLVFCLDAAAAQVEAFAPTGSVKGVRQVSATFSEAMVPLGEPFGGTRAEQPFAVDCVAAGRGRWLDARRWVYDFAAPVPGGVACRFDTVERFAAVSGSALARATFAFDTGGPSIVRSLPEAGNTAIDESGLFVVAPDAPVDPATVRANVTCEVGGIGEKIPVDVLEGAERRAVLDAQRQRGYPYARLLVGDEGTGNAPLAPATVATAEQQLVVLRCRRTLPAERDVHLVWGSGVATPDGAATADDQTLAFRIRAAFAVRFECPRVNARAACLPGSDMSLVFTAPVPRALAGAIVLEGADGARAPALDEGATLERVSFRGPFAPRAKFRVLLPAALRDDADRAPVNASLFPLDVATDEYPPLAKFAGEFGILESREGGVLPVTLRNLEADVGGQRLPATVPGRKVRVADDAEIVRWLERVRGAMVPRGEWETDPDGRAVWRERTGSEGVLAGASGTESFAVPRAEGVDAAEFQVVGIPLETPGFHVVELASPRLGAALLGEGAGPRFVATAALVTDTAVHFQWGRERSLVWVTALSTGQPVAGADVRISNYCTGDLLWRGVTGDDGVAQIAGTGSEAPLPPPHEQSGCESWHDAPLFVSARLQDDLGFTLSSWTNGIAPADFGMPEGRWDDPETAHTVLDRTLLRAGETVSMKHLLRRRTGAGFAIPADHAAATLALHHDGSGESIEMPAAFDAAGIAESTWQIPDAAKLGRYQIELRFPRADGEQSFWTGSFRVEQYRVPTMRAVIQPPAQPLVDARSATIDVFLEYLAGGGAAGAAVNVRTLVAPRVVSHPRYEGFVFGGDDVVPGSEVDVRNDWFADDATAAAPAQPARLTPVVLDRTGSARVTLDDLPQAATAQELTVELEYADANGEIGTVARRIPLSPAALELGIRTEGWVASATSLRFRVLALDLAGKPLADRDVDVTLYARKTYSYRKRLVGGFYAYESRAETTPLDAECSGSTNAQGLMLCEVEPGVAGEVVLRASAADDAGRIAIATRSMWLAGAEDWWFAPGDSDRMDVLPEADEYEAGDTARLQVRMPFRDATALVTVAREGVLTHFVTELSGSEPVIELPVEPGFAPNVYVEVLAVRGRVGSLQTWLADLVRDWELPWQLDGGSPTALVDLSKPAYRLGVARFDVGVEPHRLDVTVTPAAQTYKVRESARVQVRVARADGGALPTDAEFAFAAVDEGLLELARNDSWNLLEAMMGRRGIEVLTSTAQMQVVGKRHYGRKAVPSGGGGGREGARELFDTLLLWRGRVPLDATGSASIDVPLVDSLTSYSLVAVANAGAGLFGTGRATIRTSQDLIVHPGLPATVREGDTLAATFTVRNASDGAFDVELRPQLTADGVAMTLAPQRRTLAAGVAETVVWPVTVPAGSERLEWRVHAIAGGASDEVRTAQRVLPAVPVRTLQATLEQLTGPLDVPIARPSDALEGRGGVEVRVAANLAGALAGVRGWMSRYPYACVEQQASVAVALRDATRWQALVAKLGPYLDRDGLVRYFPSDALAGDDALTAYLLTIAHESGWGIPDNELGAMLDGLTGFVEGRIVRASDLPAADLAIRKLAALAALARYGRAQARLLGSFALEPGLWPASALVDWREILERVQDVDAREARIREADAQLRARLHASGSALGLARDDSPWWLLASGDATAARLLAGATRWRGWRDDAPRLARGTLARLDEGRWDTTPANAWGVLAFGKFGAAFEAVPVAGETQARIDETVQRADWATAPDGTSLAFDWPAAPARLRIGHAGAGAPWAFVSVRAAVPLVEPRSAGYRIERSVVPIEQKTKGRFTRGDVAEIRIRVDSPAAATWVVVDDPVPTGATILGSGLGRDAVTRSVDDAARGAGWLAWVERRADAYRAYYRYVGVGRVELAYRIRLDNPGVFPLPPTRAEAMYAPGRFAEWPNAAVEVAAP